jgi:hypothetical protein
MESGYGNSTMRNIALLILAVGLGSTLPDLDHILPPYARSWGHSVYVPLALLGFLAIAYIGRCLRTRILGR